MRSVRAFNHTQVFQVSLVEIPAHVFVALSVDHLGRKTMFVVSLFLNGFGCISAAFVPEGAVKVLVALIGMLVHGMKTSLSAFSWSPSFRQVWRGISIHSRLPLHR